MYMDQWWQIFQFRFPNLDTLSCLYLQANQACSLDVRVFGSYFHQFRTNYSPNIHTFRLHIANIDDIYENDILVQYIYKAITQLYYYACIGGVHDTSIAPNFESMHALDTLYCNGIDAPHNIPQRVLDRLVWLSWNIDRYTAALSLPNVTTMILRNQPMMRTITTTPQCPRLRNLDLPIEVGHHTRKWLKTLPVLDPRNVLHWRSKISLHISLNRKSLKSIVFRCRGKDNR